MVPPRAAQARVSAGVGRCSVAGGRATAACGDTDVEGVGESLGDELAGDGSGGGTAGVAGTAGSVGDE
jgi:hypothetical protein